MLAIVLAVAIGVVMAGHIADRIFLPQIAQYGTERVEHLKYIRLLEKDRGQLRESITMLKARESLITEATLRDLGLDKHYRIVKNKERTP